MEAAKNKMNLVTFYGCLDAFTVIYYIIKHSFLFIYYYVIECMLIV